MNGVSHQKSFSVSVVAYGEQKMSMNPCGFLDMAHTTPIRRFEMSLREMRQTFDHLGWQLYSGEEYSFKCAGKTVTIQGQLRGSTNELVAFQVWPGNGSTLFMSFAENKITSIRRAGLFCAKMIIDWAADQQDIESDVVADELYEFIETEEGQSLWNATDISS